jgi:hypothetical protein
MEPQQVEDDYDTAMNLVLEHQIAYNGEEDAKFIRDLALKHENPAAERYLRARATVVRAERERVGECVLSFAGEVVKKGWDALDRPRKCMLEEMFKGALQYGTEEILALTKEERKSLIPKLFSWLVDHATKADNVPRLGEPLSPARFEFDNGDPRKRPVVIPMFYRVHRLYRRADFYLPIPGSEANPLVDNLVDAFLSSGSERPRERPTAFARGYTFPQFISPRDMY